MKGRKRDKGIQKKQRNSKSKEMKDLRKDFFGQQRKTTQTP